jgi:opacity protein-like surface antigen
MKLKYTFAIILLTLISLPILAQDAAKSFVGISGGISAPLGNYSKTDMGTFNNWNNKSGFAKTGFNVELEGAYYLFPKIGIGGVLNFSDHGRLNKSDAQKLGDSYTDAFAVDFTTVSASKRYQTLNLLVGPCLSLPFNKLTFDFRLLGGLTKSLSTPEISVQLEDDPANVFTQKSSTASAFGWQAGIGLRYSITEKIALSIRGDYFSTGGVKITNENRNNTAGRLVTKQAMSWINASLGLAYVFGK